MHDISGMNPYLWANTGKVEDAGIAAEKELQSEISRLQNLARLNPAIDQSEIKNLQIHQAELEEALAETRFRLDSLHLVVVEN